MKTNLKKLSSQYVKIVEWSEEDGCYVGRCPELFGGGCHGKDEAAVYSELCRIVEDTLEDRLKSKTMLPVPVVAAKYSGKFLLRTGPPLHKALAIRAWREGKSLNQICLEAIEAKTSVV